MLYQFTWQQFLVAALVLSAIWYITVAVVFYKDKIRNILNNSGLDPAPEPLKHAWQEDYDDELEEKEFDDLIGKPAQPEGLSKVEMHMFGFAPTVKLEVLNEAEERQEMSDTDREVQQSIVPDALEELKRVFHILENENGKKEDFISLFGLIATRYKDRIKGTPNQAALNEYIAENLPFAISNEELDKLWS